MPANVHLYEEARQTAHMNTAWDFVFSRWWWWILNSSEVISSCEGHSHRVFVSVACDPHINQKEGVLRNFFTALRLLHDWNFSLQLISLYFFRMDLIANTSRGTPSILNVVLLSHCIVWHGNLVAQYYDWDTSWMNGVRFPGESVVFFFVVPTRADLSPTHSAVQWLPVVRRPGQ